MFVIFSSNRPHRIINPVVLFIIKSRSFLQENFVEKSGRVPIAQPIGQLGVEYIVSGGNASSDDLPAPHEAGYEEMRITTYTMPPIETPRWHFSCIIYCDEQMARRVTVNAAFAVVSPAQAGRYILSHRARTQMTYRSLVPEAKVVTSSRRRSFAPTNVNDPDEWSKKSAYARYVYSNPRVRRRVVKFRDFGWLQCRRRCSHSGCCLQALLLFKVDDDFIIINDGAPKLMSASGNERRQAAAYHGCVAQFRCGRHSNRQPRSNEREWTQTSASRKKQRKSSWCFRPWRAATVGSAVAFATPRDPPAEASIKTLSASTPKIGRTSI